VNHQSFDEALTEFWIFYNVQNWNGRQGVFCRRIEFLGLAGEVLAKEALSWFG